MFNKLYFDTSELLSCYEKVMSKFDKQSILNYLLYKNQNNIYVCYYVYDIFEITLTNKYIIQDNKYMLCNDSSLYLSIYKHQQKLEQTMNKIIIPTLEHIYNNGISACIDQLYTKYMFVKSNIDKKLFDKIIYNDVDECFHDVIHALNFYESSEFYMYAKETCVVPTAFAYYINNKFIPILDMYIHKYLNKL